MITIVNVLVGLGFVGTIALLIFADKELVKSDKQIEELKAMIQSQHDIIDKVKEDREYWMNMAVEMTDNYIDGLGVLDDFVEPTEEEIDNPFAVEHIDGYDVTEVSYVRDANGNWTTTNVHYEKN